MPSPRLYPAKPNKVYLYATCLVDAFDPDTGMDAIAVLESQGIDVIYIPKQTCCGQPAYSSGYTEEAIHVAESQMALFPEPYPIVILSGSCGGMMVHHYPRLFNGHAQENQALAFAERVFEFTEFLSCVCRSALKDTGKPTQITLHTSCAARREMNVHTHSAHLLKQLSDVDVLSANYEEECCGFGGTFSIRHPNISEAMVNDKSRNLRESGAIEYVSADWGCMLNINGALEYQGQAFKGRHLARFIAERIGVSGGNQ
ncbi:(Fe-S)-binding protein [Enterovibrio nigricans]|uniref:L-lactate dehydrogenase complex protein LldE n=1 Tax=Enterovibrio nigricans DSM 22720 TaxID=1121868 RepID=A0A1T4V221_9GAMM|nr:(Fe-S)-binding protein [Enterovibrio nigricans]PKF50451.1 (Fe-S)-binding protein [Enterovibrio nigricans]SKA58996.1 L-lactate dehydrogenase complex protein LldE [Enterovibrio nigricans DSM 22720]